MRIPRRLVQIGFFLFFLLAVGMCVPPWQDWTFLPEMIRLDPLLFVGSWISSGRLPPGVVQAGSVVLVTLVLGRFFCSHICPLGTTLDMVSGLNRSRGKRSFPQAWRKGKYLVLIVLLAAALWGENLTSWGSPMSLVTRLYALVVWPFVRFLLHPLGWVPVGYASEPVRVANLGWIVLLLGGVIGTAWIVPRFWCRYLCPTGGLLAVLSRISLFSRRVSPECSDCGLCAWKCPAGVASAGEVPAGECFECRTCARTCPVHAVSWEVGSLHRTVFWPQRRQAIGALALGTGAAWVSFSGLWAYRGEREKGQPVAETRIRPPGAVPEAGFLDLCVRCGACMRVCPSNMLHPQGGEQGVQSMFAPLAVPRRGQCRPDCAACGRVCPTGALRNLPIEEKMWAKMGTAVIDKTKCLAWEWDRACLVCDEACPYGAIDLGRSETGREAVPFVREERCTGCGACEHACPVQGRAAITVTPTGSVRLWRESYVREGKMLGLSIGRRGHKEVPERQPPSPAPGDGGLPPGFTQ